MRALLAACWLVAAAGTVHAQDCAEGRIRTEGLCCWPGQTFDLEARLCVGAPHCPEGLVEHGETCVAPVAPPPPRYTELVAPPPIETGPVVPPVVAPPPPERATDGWPARHEDAALSRAVRRHGEDGGLVAAAMVVFDIGWTFGLLVAILEESGGGNCATGFFGSGGHVSCGTAPLALIPVGGGMAAGTMNFSGSFRSQSGYGWAFGIPSVILQGSGLVMMAIVLANEVHDLGFVPLGSEDVRFTLVPGVQGADVGLSGVLVF